MITFDYSLDSGRIECSVQRRWIKPLYCKNRILPIEKNKRVLCRGETIKINKYEC
jgi:hypothetical protein